MFSLQGNLPQLLRSKLCHLRSVELMGQLDPNFCVASSMKSFVCYRVATCNNANCTVICYVFCCCTLGCVVTLLLDVVVISIYVLG